MIVLYSVIVVLSILVITLVLRVVTTNIEIRNIIRDLEDITEKDTNILLTTSSGDKSIKSLVDSLNKELKKLLSIKREYSKGVFDVKKSAENIAHDIRTPLTVIKGYVDLLEEEDLSEEGKKCLEIIKGRTRYMKEMTDELFLSLSMKSRGVLSLSDIDAKSVLEEALVSFYNEFKKKGMTPSIITPNDKVILKADSKALYRVYSNIISNALKYGEGEFNVQMDEKGNITFSNYAPNMDSVEANKLLDRYYTISDAKASSGIGLSISNEILQEMGGELKVRLDNKRLYISIIYKT
ncbi:MAG: HAMP domain-containing sensor histidine kinase [Spirochaetales bacterium]|nr:HAMP domain-containing sensor histidine kinase [Spirochaetales bacterium]